MSKPPFRDKNIIKGLFRDKNIIKPTPPPPPRPFSIDGNFVSFSPSEISALSDDDNTESSQEQLHGNACYHNGHDENYEHCWFQI